MKNIGIQILIWDTKAKGILKAKHKFHQGEGIEACLAGQKRIIWLDACWLLPQRGCYQMGYDIIQIGVARGTLMLIGSHSTTFLMRFFTSGSIIDMRPIWKLQICQSIGVEHQLIRAWLGLKASAQ